MNKHLQELMPGLTIKVFRTYNASITLSDLLKTTDASLEVAGKKAAYDEANKEVAILCNHQKGVSKNHDAAMGKLVDKKKALQEELREASGGAVAKLRYGWKRCVWCLVVLYLTPCLACHRERIATLDRAMQSKESLKTVSLGTSKINYLDPRITVAWCKTHEVPIEKIYTKVLLDKFNVRVSTGRASTCVCSLTPVCCLPRSGPWRRSQHSTSRQDEEDDNRTCNTAWLWRDTTNHTHTHISSCAARPSETAGPRQGRRLWP